MTLRQIPYELGKEAGMTPAMVEKYFFAGPCWADVATSHDVDKELDPATAAHLMDLLRELFRQPMPVLAAIAGRLDELQTESGKLKAAKN